MDLDRIVKQFDDAWRRGERPEIGDFVTGSGDDRTTLLVELVHVDLERRLKAGEAVVLDSYFERFPELASERPALELAMQSHARQDESSKFQRFLARLPEFREGTSNRIPKN